MKKIFQYIILGMSLLACLVACYGLDDQDYAELTPITITVASDTITADLGIELNYTGVTVTSDLDVSFEWDYGEIETGSTASDHLFEDYETISTSLTIDYTFTEIGTYLLRLRADNGESIEYYFFTLFVNSGYDEGIMVLSNDDDGNGDLTFIKTLTSEEQAAGEEEVFDDVFGSVFPEYGQLGTGTAIFMSHYVASKVDGYVFLVATDDGKMWHIEPKTMEMYASVSLDEGMYAKEFGGEYTNTLGFGIYFVTNDGSVYRYDVQGAFNTYMESFTEPLTRCPHLYSAYNSAGSTVYAHPIPFSEDGIYTRKSGTQGVRGQSVDGYKIVNAAYGRDYTMNYVYVLMESETEEDSYAIYRSSERFSSTTLFKSSMSEIRTFTVDGGVRMDLNSIMVNTRNSSDTYYTYNDCVYRWGLSTAPGTSPVITLPDGEEIRSMCTNFMGRDDPTNGEDYLYIATYNSSRSGDKKGSLYVYAVADETLYKSYEGIFYDPVQIVYKYRLN